MSENFILRHADQRYSDTFTKSSAQSSPTKEQTTQPSAQPMDRRDIQEYFDRRHEFESQEQPTASPLAKYLSRSY